MLTFEREAAKAKENRRRLILAFGVVVFTIIGAIVVRASIPESFWNFRRRLQAINHQHQREMLEMMIPGPPPEEGTTPE